MLQSEAQEATGLGRTSFFERRQRGEFESRTYTTAVIVRRTDVDRWLRNLEVA